MPQPIKKQTWSNLDVFGLLNGVSTWDDQYKTLLYVRKPFDTNLDVRDKIYRFNDYKPDITNQGLINALNNEFSQVPYNVNNQFIFSLTNNPVPSGNINIQDISGFYKTSDGKWETLGPQLWNQDYYYAKQNKIGFIVWQNNKFSNIPGTKNFDYSTLVEVFKELPDLTEVKFEYYIESFDDSNNKVLLRYTDLNDQGNSDDNRYTYRIKKEDLDLSGNIIAYTLSSIPSKLNALYFDNNKHPTQFFYDLRNHIDSKFRHTWDKIIDNSCIWDVQKNYGSGQLNSFYDAIAPENNYKPTINYTGYLGGVESLSYSLYTNDFVEVSGDNKWYLRMYPGKFYLDGISFYYFENPQTSYLNLSVVSSGEYSGLYSCSIPSGLTRGMYSIASKSGFYNNYYCNNIRDSLLPNVYEDYSYRTGIDGDKFWGDIYRKRPFLTSTTGSKTYLDMGQYSIDFNNNKIYFKLPTFTGYNKVHFIWDNTVVPSGSYLQYDLNPINDQNLSFEKFFLYLSLAPNGLYSSNIRPPT